MLAVLAASLIAFYFLYWKKRNNKKPAAGPFVYANAPKYEERGGGAGVYNQDSDLTDYSVTEPPMHMYAPPVSGQGYPQSHGASGGLDYSAIPVAQHRGLQPQVEFNGQRYAAAGPVAPSNLQPHIPINGHEYSHSSAGQIHTQYSGQRYSQVPVPYNGQQSHIEKAQQPRTQLQSNDQEFSQNAFAAAQQKSGIAYPPPAVVIPDNTRRGVEVTEESSSANLQSAVTATGSNSAPLSVSSRILDRVKQQNKAAFDFWDQNFFLPVFSLP